MYLSRVGRIVYDCVLKKSEHLKEGKLITEVSVSCLSWMQLFNVINFADRKHPATLVVDTKCSYCHTKMHSLNIQNNRLDRIN